MREQILDNIYSLYRSRLITAIIFLVLIILAVVVILGVIKFDIVKSLKGRIVLIVTVVVCSVFLVISQIVTISPIYQDYRDSSYTVVDDATIVINGDSTGLIDRTNTVFLKTKNKEYELIIQTDLKLDIDTEYVGSIAFLKHSKYIVWYDFE